MDKLYIASRDEFFLLLDEYFQSRYPILPNTLTKEKPTNRLALTRQEAAAETGFCLSKIDQLIKAGQIKATKVGRSVRIGCDEIDNLINKSVSDGINSGDGTTPLRDIKRKK